MGSCAQNFGKQPHSCPPMLGKFKPAIAAIPSISRYRVKGTGRKALVVAVCALELQRDRDMNDKLPGLQDQSPEVL